MSDSPQHRRAWIAAGLIAAVITAIAWIHLGASAPQPHGVHGDEYVEHDQRMMIVHGLHEGAWRDPGELVRLADMDYPPGIHTVGVPLGMVLGHGAERITWTWMGWIALLGLALAWIVDSLGGGAIERAAAFASPFLIPALPAAATRYHFDVPMLVLCWVALACALGSWEARTRRQRLLGGALTGVIAFGAMLMKWTAVPFLLCMLGVAFIRPGDGWRPSLRRRLPAAAVTAAVAGSLVAAFLAVSSESLDSMSTTFTLGQDLERTGLLALLPTPIARAASRVTAQAPFLPTWLTYYGLTSIFQVLSPLLAALIALLSLRWLTSDRRGLVLLLLILGGGLAFLTLNVPIPDSRFILPLAPLAGLVAVLGWSSLGPRLRLVAGLTVVLIGVGVAADFHLRTAPALRQGSNLWHRNLRDQGGTVMHRGLGLASSSKDRGWVRRDEALAHRHGFRDRLWSAWLGCGGGLAGLSTNLISYGADRYWWQYRARLARVRGEADADAPWPSVMEIVELESPESPQPTMLFVRAEAPDRAVPAEAAHLPWERRGFVADPDGSGGAVVFSRPDVPCRGLPR